jgi:hypothetical protein
MSKYTSTAPAYDQPCPGHPTQEPDPSTAHQRPPSEDVPRPSDDPPYLAKHARPGGPASYSPADPHTHPHDHGEPHEHGEQPHDDTHPDDSSHAHDDAEPAPADVTGAPRQNQRNLTPQAREELFRRIRDYIASPVDPVRIHLENGHVHGTLRFLPWHRQFIRAFEEWQRAMIRDASDFLPLVFWDPSDPIPREFWESGMSSSIPSLVLPTELRVSGGLATLDFATFSRLMEAHHNDVHNAIGGDMADPRVSPRRPVFWLVHAFYDNVYATWERLTGGRNS